jgi:formylglycine-generating enzyme required for sulfatase activity
MSCNPVLTMKAPLWATAACCAALSFAQAADPVVTNVRATQRTGTKLVDIWYDVSGATNPAYVTLQVSSNGGTTFAVPATALSGDVGTVTAQGRNKRIVWNAGADWNAQVSNTMKFRVAATDAPPVPEGFAYIPAGNFTMGDQAVPPVGDSDELPVHSVHLAAFLIAKRELTKEEWTIVRDWGAFNGYTELRVGDTKGVNHPVYGITWYDAVKWCNARSEKEGLTPCYTAQGSVYRGGQSEPQCAWKANGYRLPTEAEWEMAARGGLSARNFPWGDIVSHQHTNYYSMAGSSYAVSYESGSTPGYHPASQSGTFPFTMQTGYFPSNGFGLFDLSGNVWEWCWDIYSVQWYSTSPNTDPRGPESGSERLIRGGSWSPNSSAKGVRCANRSRTSPTSIFFEVGTRIAKTSN